MTLLKVGKMTAMIDVMRQKPEMIWKMYFFQNLSLLMLDNFYHDKLCTLRNLDFAD